MTVKPSQLENPERDLILANRDGDGKRKRDEQDPELLELRQRLASARTLQPSGSNLHCRDCFQRGRDAVLRHLEGT